VTTDDQLIVLAQSMLQGQLCRNLFVTNELKVASSDGPIEHAQLPQIVKLSGVDDVNASQHHQAHGVGGYSLHVLHERKLMPLDIVKLRIKQAGTVVPADVFHDESLKELGSGIQDSTSRDRVWPS
jgi:hypothetical protein